VSSGRIYTVPIVATAVTLQVDLWELTPADDKPIEIYGLFISQSSDAKDVEDEQLAYSVIRGFTTSGSGGSAPTPSQLDRSGAAAGFTAEILNTTLAVTGTTVTLHAGAFNVRAGEPMWLPEGSEWDCSQADTRIVIRLGAAPADSLTISGTVYVRERG
jgi:hypothetical protein